MNTSGLNPPAERKNRQSPKKKRIDPNQIVELTFASDKRMVEIVPEETSFGTLSPNGSMEPSGLT